MPYLRGKNNTVIDTKTHPSKVSCIERVYNQIKRSRDLKRKKCKIALDFFVSILKTNCGTINVN